MSAKAAIAPRVVRNGPVSQVDETIARYGVFVALVASGPVKPVALWREISPARPELTKAAVAGMLRYWACNGAAKNVGYGAYKPLLSVQEFETVWRARSSARIQSAHAAAKPYRERVAADASARRAELIPPPVPRAPLLPRTDVAPWLRGVV